MGYNPAPVRLLIKEFGDGRGDRDQKGDRKRGVWKNVIKQVFQMV